MHCDQKLVYPDQNAFSALDVTESRAQLRRERRIAVDKDVATAIARGLTTCTKLGSRMRAINCYAQLRLPRETRPYIMQGQRLRQTSKGSCATPQHTFICDDHLPIVQAVTHVENAQSCSVVQEVLAVALNAVSLFTCNYQW